MLLARGMKPAGAGVLASRDGAIADGRTALMLAAHSGHLEAARLLLDAGAEWQTELRGQTAVALAATLAAANKAACRRARAL